MEPQEISVEMASYAFGEAPQVLVARGLGSCIALALYHRESKLGALGHVMLPDSTENVTLGNPLRFMDRMIDIVLQDFLKQHIISDSLEAKIVGGANMFPFLNKEIKLSPSMGERNIEMAHLLMEKKGITITSEDVGGNYGRSLRFHLDTGIVVVEKII